MRFQMSPKKAAPPKCHSFKALMWLASIPPNATTLSSIRCLEAASLSTSGLKAAP